MESTLAKRTLAKAEMENVGDVFLELTPLRAAFPTLAKHCVGAWSTECIQV